MPTAVSNLTAALVVAQPEPSTFGTAPTEGLFGQLFAAALATTSLADESALPLAPLEPEIVESLASELAGATLLNPNIPLTPLPAAIEDAGSELIQGAVSVDDALIADQSRTEQLRLRLPELPQADPPALPEVNANTAANPLTASTTPIEATTVPTAEAPALVATTSQAPVQVVVAQSANVPPPAPVVTDLIPRVPTPVTLIDQPPAPRAADSTPPIPQSLVGDRPSTAGEKFAAIISSAERLAANRPSTGRSEFQASMSAALTAQPDRGAVPALPVEPAAAALNAGRSSLVSESVVDVSSRLALPVDGRDLRDVAERPSREIRMESTSATGSTSGPGAWMNLQPSNEITTARVAATVHTTAPTPAVQIADDVIVQSRRLDKEGSVEFRMRLDPPDLGPVRVHLVSTGDELRGHVVVADHAVRHLIESQLPELRQRLEAAGLTVQQFDVSADGRNGNQNRYGAEAGSEWIPRLSAPAPDGARNKPLAQLATTGHLDVVV